MRPVIDLMWSGRELVRPGEDLMWPGWESVSTWHASDLMLYTRSPLFHLGRETPFEDVGELEPQNIITV